MTGPALRLPECPRFIAAVLQRLPSFPPSFALATALNIGLAPQLPQDVREMFRNRRFRIFIRDAHVVLDFSWNGSRFVPIGRHETPDVTITASGPDFLILAQRLEDPDTLFFSRRLMMEGDTELGLVVKNTLDALELPVLDIGRFLRKPAAAPAASKTRHTPWNS